MASVRIDKKPTRTDFKDLTGQRVKDWLVLDFSHTIMNTKTKSKMNYWKCLCTNCNGSVKIIAKSNLCNKNIVKNCGCTIKRRERTKDLTDQMFGFLLVDCIDEESTVHSKTMWKTTCTNCGRVTSKPGTILLKGKIKSCGARECKAKIRAMNSANRS